MIFVSSPKHIKELDGAPDHILSLNGAAKHVSISKLARADSTDHKRRCSNHYTP
jgi:hypothetical protein